MTDTKKLETFGVIDPGTNILLEVVRAPSAIDAVRRLETSMRGADYVAARDYAQGGEESLNGTDPVYLVYALDDSGLDAEGLARDDAGLVRESADEVGVFVSSPKAVS
ncbi:hypothetical protein [Acetobacter indonesiensis]|jgi:hypothetical protein|uniref:hypothetical protein n=1 Tax=Acetobacter indonesiensis TaxID=104101 RepID=UPI000A39B16A|nr:hypothetical protein [Acetobacter indonesiensis]MCG0994033.1 hypothetical protein [Acetobacter indonesiensis]MCI1438006.1 hypothetical protein [Acetobacter indonesiensis]MCI1545595.1 hypothetical protein [Acetobacter indonesiensis]MCI1765241.1 hypothetical protein [Acetobacter indonesiensis]MCP1230636.1 hypothetical protein [Acetobacter indonesiensis]